MNSRSRFDVVDYALFALGVMGLALFVWLLPSQHPDSAASYALGREEASEAARAFLERQGYATENLTPVARLARQADLLDSLQASQGRPETIRLLEGGEDQRLPAHYWNVRWHRKDVRTPFGRPETVGGPSSEWLAFEVDVTQHGETWQFRNPSSVVPHDGVNRDVLQYLLDEDPEMRSMLMAPPDSVLGPLFYFDLSSAARPTDSLALFEADWNRLHAAATTGLPQGLGEAAATGIARRHLAATALSAFVLDVKTVEALPERGRAAARVRFETHEPVHGQRVSAEVDVTPAGALLALRTRFNEEREGSRSGDDFQFQLGSDRGARGALKWAAYFTLILILLGVLFRRVSGRALDAQAALKDAILAATLASVAMVLSTPTLAVQVGYGWQLAIAIGLGMLFVGAGLGLLVFVASGASDALARAVWPEKITTLTLTRQHAWVNQPVGVALLRGAALAGVILGITVLAMVLVPHGVLHSESLLGADSTFSHAATAVAQGVWYALLLVLAVHTGLGSILQRRWPWVVVPALALALAVVGFDGVELIEGSPAVVFGIPLVLGVVLALAFKRYDALTLLAAVVLTGVLWDTAEGWLVSDSPDLIDAVVAWVFALGLVSVGVAGVRSDRTGEQLPIYEPEYVTEQRERGRLQRELEIAREVQRSFLPTHMPCIPGLDIAAVCLAAEEVGGDYYDVIPLDDRRLAIVIGDVSGKGIQASFFMTLAKGYLQALAYETASPAEVLRRANRLFFASAPRGTFISLIYGVFDLEDQSFTFARAGHNPVILKRSPNQTADFVQPAGLAIGLTSHAVFDETIQEDTIALRHGDTLVFYTDGFSEAMDPAKHLYTDERLADAVAATSAEVTADALLKSLVNDVVGHAGTASQHNDMTMLVVRVGGSTPGTVPYNGAPTTHFTSADA